MDGKTVHVPYLNGTQRGINQEIAIPDVPQPAENQWRVWKSFIFRNFLSPGTTINPQLGEDYNNNNIPTLPVSETDRLLGMVSEGKSISEMISNLPMSLQQMVGQVIIPNDDGLAISEVIVEGRCLGVSNGSLIKGFRKQKGSHGYAIGKQDNNLETIQGLGPPQTVIV